MSVSPLKPQISVSSQGKVSLFELDLSYCSSLLEAKDLKSRKDQTTESSTPTSSMFDSICCICGGESFLTPCEKAGCAFKVHLFCLSYFFPELKGSKAVCPSHSFSRLEDCAKLVHLSSQFNLLEDLSERVRNKTNDQTTSGNFFWFGICQQYFPFFQITKPIFQKNSNFSQHSQENSWISTKIQENLQKLSEIETKIDEIFKEIPEKSRNFSKNPKLGENLENSYRMNLALQGKFIRKYEKSQIKSLAGGRKDYEAASICAVCDLSGDDFRLTTCSNCLISVHPKCYQLTQSEAFWLCDHCKVHPMSAKTCFLCPVQGGALKLAQPHHWVHVTCAKHLQEPATDLDIRLVNQAKFKLKCFSCGVKTGACVQCSYGRCANAFHVECRKDLLDSDSWLCPHHKASKLTRQVRDSFEDRLSFIKSLALNVWNSLIGFKLPAKRKYVKSKKRVKESTKTKFFIDFKDDSALLKVFAGGKLLKVVKYVEESRLEDPSENLAQNKTPKPGPGFKTLKTGKKSKLSQPNKSKNQLRTEEKLINLPLEVKKLGKTSENCCFKGFKDELGVKLKLPKSLLQESARKKAKTSDFP